MNKYIKLFGSLKISLILFIVFAFFCAIATFIESSYGTPTAWAMIYDTAYFELIQILLGINLICAIFVYKMYGKKKIPLFLFHISFIFILLGSGLTRYGGFEGLMHIREGKESTNIESSKSYIRFYALKDNIIYWEDLSKNISLLPFVNNFEMNLNINGEIASLKYKNLLLNPKQEIKEDKNGHPILSLIINTKEFGAKEINLVANEIKNINGINFSFLNDQVKKPYIKIDKNLKISSSEKLDFHSMINDNISSLKAYELANIEQKRLYTINDMNFTIKFLSLNANISYTSDNQKYHQSFFSWLKYIISKNTKDINQNYINALELTLTYKNESKDLVLFEFDNPLNIELGGQNFFLSWGKISANTPFKIRLKDFVIDRYPGSMSPASYASEVEVIDGEQKFDYRIFMNNVLDYKGFRFYQSSYDQDELGTVLSVNKDPGKIVTYIGYFLLMLGMFLNILNPNSRFRILAKLINKDTLKHNISILCIITILGFGVNTLKADDKIAVISNLHTKDIASLVVQKHNGRMVPFDTLSNEILGKVYKNTKYKNFNANNIVMSMYIFPQFWAKEEMIIMPKNKDINKELSNILKINQKKFISYMDFFDENGNYKLLKYVENVNRKNPNSRSSFDKELIKLDERANILNLIFGGNLLKIFPLKNSKDNSWISPNDIQYINDIQKQEISVLLSDFINANLLNTIKDNNSNVKLAINNIKDYQKQFGNKVLPSDTKIKTEIFVNKAEIFIKLTPFYLITGLLLLVLVLIKMIRPKTKINLIFNIVYLCNILAFIVHSIGLALRGYLADHAPWSNAYESMIYIAWALALSGIFFSKKSPIALSLTSILAGLTLWVAHLSEMDPQITNLVPVLDSYWLTIHVSVITASYGFFGLCTMLGIFVLILMCFLKKDGFYNQNIQRNITEATRINEMAMILGLCLLTVGNFLGAIWANESWGRYWSWDSKETWSLISILIYAFVLHIRLIPSLANQYTFAIASMFAYWSIIMTYFGVNYFLVGMHSYAASDAVKIPVFVYWGAIFMILLAFIGFFKKKYIKHL